MPYNPVTNQYDPDMNDFSSWFQTPQQQPDYTTQAQTQSQNPTQVNPAKPGNPYPASGQPYPSAPPGYTYGPDGQVHPVETGTPSAPTQPDLFNNPAPGQGAGTGDEYWKNSPFYQPGMPASTAPAAQTAASLPLPVGTGNPGNDRNNPPDNSGDWFWSGTANHWVDSTGKRDATGRDLTTGEQAFWQGNNQRRASGTLGADDARMMQWGNTQYPAGFTDVYKPVVTPPAATVAAATTPYDYTKTGSVPGYTFEKNVYADTNAQQSFLELQGVMDADKLQKAQDLYGWQKAVPDSNPDGNAVYAKAIEMAKADPNSDYSIVKVAMPDGSVGYGVLKRENGGGNTQAMQDAQSARGFISPAVAIARAAEAAKAAQASQGSGGGGRPSYPNSVSNLPRPQAAPAAAPSNNPLTQRGTTPGQVINYKGDNWQWNGSTWIRYNYGTTNPRPTGPQMPKMV